MSGAYRVLVTREDDAWLAEVPELEGAHTYARTLGTLDRYVREVVVLAADLSEEAGVSLALEYDYRIGDEELDSEAAHVRRLRAKADQIATRAAEDTAAAARRLTAAGLSVRDAAVLLGVSPQRISQLTGHADAG